MTDSSQLQALLLDLLSTPSPQADPQAVRSLIADHVRPALPPELFDEISIDDAGNLLARRHGPPGTSPLLLYTYSATYPAENMPHPYPGRVMDVDGTRYVRGRGAAEQRPGLAASIVGLVDFLRGASRLRRGIDFVTCVAGEMGNHLVATELVAAHALTPAAVVIAVSSNNQLCLGNLGRIDVHVTVHGKSTHSSSPANGINALDGARRFLNNLAEISLDRRDLELGQPSLTPIVLQTSPRAAHTIPSQAEMTLDCRLIPGDDIEAIVESIRACAVGLEPCWAEVRVGHINYPNKVPLTSEVARATRDAMVAAGLPGEIVYKRSALDAGYFTRLGFDSVVFGPGDPALAHADEERVDLAQLVAAAEVYRRLCQAMCEE